MIELGESGSSTLANRNCLFVDTNLGTGLALLVHHNDNISDFKDIFCLEHKNCFPQLGDIRVSAFKIKRRGHFYQLLDTMTMINIFGPMKADWFMSVDAVMEEVKDDHVMEEVKDDALMEGVKDDHVMEEVKDDALMEGVKDDLVMEVKDAVNKTSKTGVGEKKKKKRKRRDLDACQSHKESTKEIWMHENSCKVDVIEVTSVKLKTKKTTKAKSPTKPPFIVLTKSPAKDIENETRKHEEEGAKGAIKSRYMLRSLTKDKKATPSITF